MLGRLQSNSNTKYFITVITTCFCLFFSLFRSFTECRCNPYGSMGRSCDKYTGQCFCRENVTGRACDRCVDGFWDLQASRGCVNCQCNPIGSRDANCSQYTGQCNCKPGVGGQTCDVCLDGFYGFSLQGCKSIFSAFSLLVSMTIISIVFRM